MHLLHANVFGIPRLPWESALAALLATPVQFYSGWQFHVKAFKSLRARSTSILPYLSFLLGGMAVWLKRKREQAKNVANCPDKATT